ncbi:GNAT family N-acetyltransferase [Aliiroseovarius sp. YM-037]|uniref:GNAT family N-acetyltransferase n=1 Tax=Aliiroseovarius sp. YM-037 TaxID=3341728 RepID=UPI003A806F7D
MGVNIPTLETERLVLRAPMRADFEPFAEVLTSDRSRYMGGPYDRRGAWSVFASGAASWIFDGFGAWSITDSKTGDYFGEIAITHPANFPETELGWTLTPKAEGRGIAFEAAGAARDWAFRVQSLTTLVSYVSPGNTRSAALAERLGAVRDDDADRPNTDDLVYRHRLPEAVQ